MSISKEEQDFIIQKQVAVNLLLAQLSEAVAEQSRLMSCVINPDDINCKKPSLIDVIKPGIDIAIISSSLNTVRNATFNQVSGRYNSVSKNIIAGR